MRKWSLALLLLVICAVLPVGGCGGTQETLSTPTESYSVDLTLDEAAAGKNSALVEVATRDGGDPAEVDDVTLAPVMVEMGHSTPVAEARPDGEPGRYRASGEFFFMAGEWDVDVRVRDGGRSEVARFTVQVEE